MRACFVNRALTNAPRMHRSRWQFCWPIASPTITHTATNGRDSNLLRTTRTLLRTRRVKRVEILILIAPATTCRAGYVLRGPSGHSIHSSINNNSPPCSAFVQCQNRTRELCGRCSQYATAKVHFSPPPPPFGRTTLIILGVRHHMSAAFEQYQFERCYRRGRAGLLCKLIDVCMVAAVGGDMGPPLLLIFSCLLPNAFLAAATYAGSGERKPCELDTTSRDMSGRQITMPVRE